MKLRGLSLLGDRVSEPRGEKFSASDRTTGDDLPPQYFSASPDDVDRAAELAAGAFRDFSRRSGPERAALLRQIANGIEAVGELLVDRIGREAALPAARVEGERARTCMQLQMFADVVEDDSWMDARIDRGDPTRLPIPKPDVRSLLRPIGPVAVFGASNFPLAYSVAGGDTAAALAAGCPVIVKAHPAHPGTSELVGRVVQEAVAASGLPAGVFSLLFDAGNDVALALVRHPRIKAGAFTGSRNGGLALWDAATRRPDPIPFFAEMSSVNPVFILPKILREKGEAIATGLHASMTLGAGQFCTQPGLIFVEAGEDADGFLAILAKLVQQTPCATMLTSGIQKMYSAGLTKKIGSKDVTLLARAEQTAKTDATAALFSTTAKHFLREPELGAELFGPSSLVIVCSSNEDFSTCARALEGQLTATIWGEETEIEANVGLLAILEEKAGRLIMNGFPTGLEVGSATVHGGPFPATTDSRFTSVGTRSIQRFLRPVAYQNFPESLLPLPLRDR